MTRDLGYRDASAHGRPQGLRTLLQIECLCSLTVHYPIVANALAAGGSLEEPEQFYFKQGDLGFPVVPTPFGVRIGLIICYDRNLPAPARCAALNGAELLFVPVTTTQRAHSRWELLLRARAVENVMFVAAANLRVSSGPPTRLISL